MFEIDENALPVVRTRQGLLLLDLQNDFLTTGGLLTVEEPPNFVDNILNLLPHFRASGNNVIWVRSQFEESRTVNEPYGDSENVILDDQISPAYRRSGQRLRPPPQRLLDQHNKIALNNRDDEYIIEESYLTVPEGKVPRVVVAASPGTNFAPNALEGFHPAEDLVFQKSYYSAFRDGTLMQVMRSKFITEVYLCGSLTNISVFATAMDAARHGYAITILEDCLGYRSKARHDAALKQLIISTGCDVIKSGDLIRELDRKAKILPPRWSRNRPTRQKERNLESLMADMTLRHNLESSSNSARSPDVGVDIEPLQPTTTDVALEIDRISDSHQGENLLPVEIKKRERVPSKIKTRRRHPKTDKMDNLELKEETATIVNSPSEPHDENRQPVQAEESPVLVDDTVQNLEPKEEQPLANQETPEGQLAVEDTTTKICEGDTTVINNLLDDELASDIFEKLRDEVDWKTMFHQGGEVPRLIAVQGQIGDDGSIPIYRHPADSSPPLSSFSPAVSQIRAKVEEALGHAINHVLIQYYRGSTDHITEHSDKTLDIVPGTFISNASFGAQRTMLFRTKRPSKIDDPDAAQGATAREACRVPLSHNSLCKVGLMTNEKWLHSIRPDKRLNREKCAEELAYDGGRISLTFRLIGTFMSKNEEKIWGQGAVAKTKEKARTVINGKTAEAEKMLLAFGKENRSSDFDWQGVYGAGFDVLHISNPRKLFFSGDNVLDMRVKIHLAELKFDWIDGQSTPSIPAKGKQFAVRAPANAKHMQMTFVDNDLSHSTVVGDQSIMLYLECVYGHSNGKPPQADLARQFTRFDQCRNFLNRWRAVPYTDKPFIREMELWESFSTEYEFMASPTVSVVDFAVWPILDEIKREWPKFSEYPNLTAYYNKLKDRESVASVVAAMKAEAAKSS
ncbi:hypothetical protein BJ875DRAFT_372181 [Amylocarpus encephaloides]|uniref:Fe2OG dioxygenase domain-containing protein n=1 Tax=Amylocarpus encephaloides TaxID=45428 RepID=A0A9P7YNU8_9HELO|nr:hypothetical protein BJ875DRAFT_372181 [Amylocarpus encephaloides]